MSNSKTLLYPNPNNSPLGPQKVKKDPKIKSNLKVVESYPNPKNSPLGPQKVNNEPKIK